MLKNTQTRIIDALTGAKAGNEFIAAVASRVALSKDTHKRFVEAVTSEKYAKEIEAAIISGATLSHEAQRRCLIMLASTVAGNDLINAIQSVPNAKPVKL